MEKLVTLAIGCFFVIAVAAIAMQFAGNMWNYVVVPAWSHK